MIDLTFDPAVERHFRYREPVRQPLADLFTLSQNLESLAIETELPQVWEANRFVDRSIEAFQGVK